MTRGRSALLAGAVAVAAFLAGYGWQFARAERLEAQLEETRRELRFEGLAATLGAATVEAQQGGYEAARRLASDFFTGLQHAMGQAPPGVVEELRSILAERDEVITLLSRGEPRGATLLAAMFVRYRLAREGARPDGAHADRPPVPAP